MSIEETISKIRKAGEQPRVMEHRDGPTPFPLLCRVVLRDRPGQVGIDSRVPEDIAWVWLHTQDMRLFEDTQYGQWGLVFLDSDAARRRTDEERARRPAEIDQGDVVIAEFLGDSDLLVGRADPEADDFGAILVALPLDHRQHWPVVGRSLSEFLERYVAAQGDKFWD